MILEADYGVAEAMAEELAFRDYLMAMPLTPEVLTARLLMDEAMETILAGVAVPAHLYRGESCSPST